MLLVRVIESDKQERGKKVELDFRPIFVPVAKMSEMTENNTHYQQIVEYVRDAGVSSEGFPVDVNAIAVKGAWKIYKSVLDGGHDEELAISMALKSAEGYLDDFKQREWEKTAEKVSSSSLVDKIVFQIEDAKDDCDHDGYAIMSLVIKGNKEQIVKIIEDCFQTWNDNNQVYTVSFERASEVFGPKDTYMYHFELSRDVGDDDSWDNDFELSTTDCIGEILQEGDLPFEEPIKPAGLYKRSTKKQKNEEKK